jgi:hypothetical protein
LSVIYLYLRSNFFTTNAPFKLLMDASFAHNFLMQASNICSFQPYIRGKQETEVRRVDTLIVY